MRYAARLAMVLALVVPAGAAAQGKAPVGPTGKGTPDKPAAPAKPVSGDTTTVTPSRSSAGSW